MQKKGEDPGQTTAPNIGETDRQAQGVSIYRAETGEWELPWVPMPG